MANDRSRRRFLDDWSSPTFIRGEEQYLGTLAILGSLLEEILSRVFPRCNNDDIIVSLEIGNSLWQIFLDLSRGGEWKDRCDTYLRFESKEG